MSSISILLHNEQHNLQYSITTYKVGENLQVCFIFNYFLRQIALLIFMRNVSPGLYITREMIQILIAAYTVWDIYETRLYFTNLKNG